jgi:rubrerythrin
MKTDEIRELLYQALETEIGGTQVYQAALRCVQNPELRGEWLRYLQETEDHRTTLLGLFEDLGLDPDEDTPGRKVLRHISGSLVQAMEMARTSATPAQAELVAAECVVQAETKDHLNWELLGTVSKELGGKSASLREAYATVEDQEDEHLYHSTGWTRELWIQSLGLPAVLPPPEETQDVKTAIAAARAKNSRKRMLES